MSSAAARDIIMSPRAPRGIATAVAPRVAGPATRADGRVGAALATNANFAPGARAIALRRAGSESAAELTPAMTIDVMVVRFAGRVPTCHRPRSADRCGAAALIFSFRKRLSASDWSSLREKARRPFDGNPVAILGLRAVHPPRVEILPEPSRSGSR